MFCAMLSFNLGRLCFPMNEGIVRSKENVLV